MKDVDTMNRGPYHKIMNDYEFMSSVMYLADVDTNPLAYCDTTYESLIKQGSYSLKKLWTIDHSFKSDTQFSMKLINAVTSREKRGRNANECNSSNKRTKSSDTSSENMGYSYQTVAEHMQVMRSTAKPSTPGSENECNFSNKRAKPSDTSSENMDESHHSAAAQRQVVRSTALEDLKQTFCLSFMDGSITRVVHQSVHRAHMHTSHRMARVFSGKSVVESVARLVNDMSINWVSLQPRVSTLAMKLSVQ